MVLKGKFMDKKLFEDLVGRVPVKYGGDYPSLCWTILISLA
ncbi:hypothetical protein XCR1_2270004 [Xenorhabdus cabanillasii JM26]|uniref:Uncharacterized protein n=1 Tax=Xenorhabdus cabanillasii JM26 TaxID=1427517 RepID=W1J443_9GAMM|nr:hypothetical protein XCR1_2270004 [Xenorhabdus cabanillasii JM26]